MLEYIFIHFKKVALSWMTLLFGIVIVLFSPTVSHNLYENIMYIFTNKWFIIMLFLSICIVSADFLETTKQVNFVLRSESLAKYIKQNIIQLLKIVLLYLSMAILITVVCFGIVHVRDFSSNILQVYSIPTWFYCLFLFLRTYLFLSLLTVILYLLGWNYKKVYSILFIVCFVVLLLFGIDIIPLENINQIFPIPIFATSYFYKTIFSNFILELSASMIQFCILFFIIWCLYYYHIYLEQKEKVK